MTQPLARFLLDHRWIEFSRPREARIIYKSKTLNLLTNQFESSGLEEFLKRLDSLKIEYRESALVIELFYELGFSFIEREALLSEEAPLAIICVFDKAQEWQKQLPKNKVELQKLEDIDFETYVDSYQKGVEHLKRGDCYQFNLTFKSNYSYSSTDSEEIFNCFATHPDKWGSFAHFLKFPQIKKCFLSNSPESLFEITENIDNLSITTTPIKGTHRVADYANADEAYLELTRSEKNQAELFMIIDLLRNDLYKIAQTKVEVLELKKRLDVPGIVHQMGVLKTSLPKTTSLLSIFKALFPGGSITGAPKIRVMEILKQIESEERGFYCGSTFVSYKNHHRASINIRSAIIHEDLKKLEIGAGGGVTLLSSSQQEFEERMVKIMSFLALISV